MNLDAKPVRLGVYEKTLPGTDNWVDTLRSASRAGYDFYELAIDESPERIARLTWTDPERLTVKQAIARTGLPVDIVTLSAHRKVPLGSADANTRTRARQMLFDAIDLAHDIGARFVQIAGYFVFYEAHHADAKRYFHDGLRAGCERADALGVRLGLENVDGEDVRSLDDALAVIVAVGHRTLGLHVDIGNLAANGFDVVEQLRLARDHIIAIDLKDTRPGEYRRVAFGDGIVPFRNAHNALATMGVDVPYAIEMWNDHADPNLPSEAAEWIRAELGPNQSL